MTSVLQKTPEPSDITSNKKREILFFFRLLTIAPHSPGKRIQCFLGQAMKIDRNVHLVSSKSI